MLSNLYTGRVLAIYKERKKFLIKEAVNFHFGLEVSREELQKFAEELILLSNGQEIEMKFIR